MQIKKSYLKLDEVCNELKITKDEILEIIRRHKIQVGQYVNGNLKFSKRNIKRIKKVLYGKTLHKEVQIRQEPKVKTVRKRSIKLVTPQPFKKFRFAA